MPDLHEMFSILELTSKSGRSSFCSISIISSSSSSSSNIDTLCAEIHEMFTVVVLTLKIGRSDTLCARFT